MTLDDAKEIARKVLDNEDASVSDFIRALNDILEMKDDDQPQ